MKTKFSGILTLLLALVVQLTFAQEKVISGIVSDVSGLPLPGVNILVKGTTTGTQSDFDGKYSINAKSGDMLSFSYVGLKSKEVAVGASNTVNVTLEEDSSVLDEVVVTAQGIKREKKALGYAVSEVESEDIEQKADGDIARILSGQASGVDIQSQNGTSGSATNVIIRGYTSINGSNQALFVVDGIPFSSDTNAQGSFTDGNVGSSRFLDIDPNNIASVSVLKGLAAATLYGAEGRNGVILITTKANSGKVGAKKTEITLTQSYFFNKIASLPDYQNSYGGGFNQAFGWFFSNWGPSFSPNGIDGYLNDPSGKIDANGTVLHPYATSGFLRNYLNGENELYQQYQGVRYNFKPYNSVADFFKVGGISNTNLGISGASKDGDVSYNVNYGHLDEKGFTPGNTVNRNTLSIGGRAKLSNRFTVNGTLNYANTDFVTPPQAIGDGNANYGLSVFGQLFFTPRSVDLMHLPYSLPENGGSIYYRNGNDIVNPRWTVANAQNSQLTNRFYGNGQLGYELNDNLSVAYRVGIDFYNERNVAYSNKNGVNADADIYGFLSTWDNNKMVWNHYLALTGNYALAEKMNLNFTLGGTSTADSFDRQGVLSTGQIVFGVQRHFNYSTQTPTQYTEERNVVGVFGQADIDYGGFIYLSLAARNDWVSNLTTENNSQAYPSASISFIPTSAFDGFGNSDSWGINYLKLRAGIGQSAGFPTGYPTVNSIVQNTKVNGGLFGGSTGIVTNSVSDFKANPDLKPELISEFEVGFDTRFLKNRVDLSVSYYDRTTKDLIVDKPLPPSTGYSTTQANIGKVEGTGWEADLGVDIFKSNDEGGFSWNSRVNFTKSEQIVTEQSDDQIVYAGFTNLGNAAIKGYQLGVIVGDRILRDANGNKVVGTDGIYRGESEIAIDENNNEVPIGTPGSRTIVPVIGNPNPDYVMNFINTISYKNFSLGFQISHTKGGDVYSQTIGTLLGRGLITDYRRDSFVVPGVLEDGSPNNIQIDNATYYFDNIGFSSNQNEAIIFDASVIRLKEVSLSYNMPKKWLDATPFGSISITASGSNLWYDAYNTPDAANFDPNVAGIGIGNGRGFDYLNGPSSKRYGLSVKASF